MKHIISVHRKMIMGDLTSIVSAVVVDSGMTPGGSWLGIPEIRHPLGHQAK